jgi:hypothetical protein
MDLSSTSLDEYIIEENHERGTNNERFSKDYW